MVHPKEMMNGFLMNAYKTRMRLDEGHITKENAKKIVDSIYNEAQYIQKKYKMNKTMRSSYKSIAKLNKEVRKVSLRGKTRRRN
jgi:polyhydroxyalkanoate synthesis regulator phasin